MRIGHSTHDGLNTRQTRWAVLLAVIFALVLGLSTFTHFTYRDVRAVVVGNTVTLGSRADGTIARVLVNENEAFIAGSPLVELSNPMLDTEVQHMQREVDELRRLLASELNGSGLERRLYDLETSFADAKSKLSSARIGVQGINQILGGLERRVEQMRLRADRAHTLLQQRAMTQSELDEREQDWLEADREYRQAVNRKRVLLAEIETYEQLLALHDRRLDHIDDDQGRTVHDLELTLAEKERELGRLRAMWLDLTVVASADGIVTSLHRAIGEYIESGEPIITVMTSRALWVEAYLPPTEKPSVQVGDRVYVLDPGGAGRMSGRVSRILPVLQSFPSGAAALGRATDKYAVVRVLFDDSREARARFSPAQEVNAQIRRRWMSVARAEPELSIDADVAQELEVEVDTAPADEPARDEGLTDPSD